MSVSVFMLVRDEAPTLERAIRSVEGLASEVVVGVDAETRDDSGRVAQSLGAKVVEVDFSGAMEGDFSRAHNHLDSLGTGEWGFKLDGHEYLAEGGGPALRELLCNSVSDYRGVAIRLQMSEDEGGVHAMVLRLYRRGPDVRYERPVHESIMGLGMAVLGRPDVVLHHDRSPSRAEARRQQRLTRDLKILASECRRLPADSVPRFHLAGLRKTCGDAADAEILALEAWRLADQAKSVFRCEIALLLARLRLEAGDPNAARDWSNECLRIHWNIPEAHCLQGEAALLDGDFNRAGFHFRTALLVPHVPLELPVAVRYHGWWPWRELGRLAVRAGDARSTSLCFQRALGWPIPKDVTAELAPWAETDIQVGRAPCP